MKYSSTNVFRRRRGVKLRGLIEALAATLGRDVRILDVGGRPDYWDNVGLARIARIEVLNYRQAELDRAFVGQTPTELFVTQIGDARDLSDYPDGSIDLVHSNSVIEHVGGWADMRAMAHELMRVGQAGWVQTPAWAFPLEPHFRAPFMHWFGRPMQARLMSLSVKPDYRSMPIGHRRMYVERINLLSRRELAELFPDRRIITERVVFPKSYVVTWVPPSV